MANATVTLDLDIKQVESLVEKLPIKEKVKLVRKLEKDTWQKRFRQLLHRIDRRIANKSISEREIDQTVEEAKEEYYAQSRNRY